MDWLERYPEGKLAFQPGTYQIKFGKERLKHVYTRTEVVALNREEAVQVTGGSYDNLHELLDKMHERAENCLDIRWSQRQLCERRQSAAVHADLPRRCTTG